MSTPPLKKSHQKNYIQSAVRFPPGLKAEITAAADRNGRSFNAEVLARLQDSRMESVLHEVEQLRAMIQILIDRD